MNGVTIRLLPLEGLLLPMPCRPEGIQDRYQRWVTPANSFLKPIGPSSLVKVANNTKAVQETPAHPFHFGSASNATTDTAKPFSFPAYYVKCAAKPLFVTSRDQPRKLLKSQAGASPTHFVAEDAGSAKFSARQLRSKKDELWKPILRNFRKHIRTCLSDDFDIKSPMNTNGEYKKIALLACK